MPKGPLKDTYPEGPTNYRENMQAIAVKVADTLM